MLTASPRNLQTLNMVTVKERAKGERRMLEGKTRGRVKDLGRGQLRKLVELIRLLGNALTVGKLDMAGRIVRKQLKAPRKVDRERSGAKNLKIIKCVRMPTTRVYRQFW